MKTLLVELMGILDAYDTNPTTYEALELLKAFGEREFALGHKAGMDKADIVFSVEQERLAAMQPVPSESDAADAEALFKKIHDIMHTEYTIDESEARSYGAVERECIGLIESFARHRQKPAEVSRTEFTEEDVKDSN